MSWVSLSAIESRLPDHCSPSNEFLYKFSSLFHTCVPTPLAFASNTLGILSIVAWLFAQLPQIYKNWSIKSTSGLSIFFLVEWCLGDLSNLLGALFTHQASWQVAIGCYYVFVDVCLVLQWVWYEKLRHGHPVFRVWGKGNGQPGGNNGDGMEQVVIEGMPVDDDSERGLNESDHVLLEGDNTNKQPTRPKIIFRTPTFDKKEHGEEKSSLFTTTSSNNKIQRAGGSSPLPSPSPRTMLMIACLIAIAQASPISKQPHVKTTDSTPTPLETTGTILSWISTVLYLGSRLPQLFKNYRRKSTAGLSPHLFIAAFCGNLFYSSALLTNPNAWHSFEPYEGGGWVGSEGSDRVIWVLAALPFFLGAFGVLGLDASVGVQFLMYGEGKVVVVEEERGYWRRVSGWMRGWVPGSIGEGSLKGAEREGLLQREGQGEGYGALSS